MKNPDRDFAQVFFLNTTYLEKQFGYFTNKSLPDWKKEGICEYIAQDQISNKELRIKLVFNKGFHAKSRSLNLTYYLIVTYLIQRKNMELEDIVNTPINFNEILQEAEIELIDNPLTI